MTTKEKIEVRKAYTEGKKIQVRDRVSREWTDWGTSREPVWCWDINEYRIKPESTYRPYKDTDEMIEDFKKRFNVKVPAYDMPMIWISYKDIMDCRLITGFMGNAVILTLSAVGMGNLFDCYTYLDGSPCGMKEE